MISSTTRAPAFHVSSQVVPRTRSIIHLFRSMARRRKNHPKDATYLDTASPIPCLFIRCLSRPTSSPTLSSLLSSKGQDVHLTYTPCIHLSFNTFTRPDFFMTNVPAAHISNGSHTQLDSADSTCQTHRR